jgi:hypothetical protein
MKPRSTIFVLLLFIILLNGLNAQPGLPSGSGIPLKPQSPLFGKDIVINDQPTQSQHHVAVCSAFNGWQYAAITYNDVNMGTAARITIMKSIDNGVTWNIVLDNFYGGANNVMSSMDILVVGNSIANLKIILSSVLTNDPSLVGYGYITVYDEETGDWESNLLWIPFCYDISLASDYLYPATNSNPHSVGILYSQYSSNGDSLIFRSSSNGGMTLDGYQKVAVTTKHFHNVALAYGRSPSWSSGRYFAAWEERDGFGLIPGRIYTSHTNPNFNSPFTTPVNLDGLDPSTVNQCQNPAIACQYNAVDNDSSNLTEMVMFEKYKPSVSKYDIESYFNLQATSSSHFKRMKVTDSTHINLQPDLSYNPYDSTFMFTYFDTTDKKLPFLKSNFNIPNPDNWIIVTPGYNDSNNISSPGPKVELNIGQPEAMNAWIANRPDGKGIAMFDAPYSTYTGVSEINKGALARLIGAYPNPCNNEIKIAFELKKSGKVIINVLSILGQPLGTVTDRSYLEGMYVVQYDVSDFPAGTYFYNFRSGDFTASGKFTVIR